MEKDGGMPFGVKMRSENTGDNAHWMKKTVKFYAKPRSTVLDFTLESHLLADSGDGLRFYNREASEKEQFSNGRSSWDSSNWSESGTE